MAQSIQPDRPRYHPGFAWGVILLVTGLIVYRQAQRGEGTPEASIAVTQAQARYLVGLKGIGFPGNTAQQLYDQARQSMDRGGWSRRLRFATVAGELAGPKEARGVLAELRAGEKEMPPSELQARMATLLDRLYIGYEKKEFGPPRLSAEECTELRDRLGWFGDLALAPEGGDPGARKQALAPARRTVFAALTISALGLLAVSAGVVLLILAGCLALAGRLQGGLEPSEHGSVYAETFALYFAWYAGLGLVLRHLPEAWGGLWLSGLAMLSSAIVLVWPILRGRTARQVRQEVGLVVGKNLFLEILYGVGCYLVALPVLLVGLLVMLGVMAVQRRLGITPTEPSHPAAGVALSSDWWVWVQLFVVAAVLAPLIEEMMFRGVLYRHLREATRGWGQGMSVLASALVSGFLFAVIHPQGWLGVLVLMPLAIVFALTREWRQSLVAPMVAHGLNNGVVSVVLYFTAG